MEASTTSRPTSPVPRVRAPRFPFREAGVPRYWLYGSPVLTHAANGLHLLFPPGERFFIRSVKHYADRLDDPALLARVRAFFGQEGRHGHEHERFNALLEAQGFRLDRFLRVYERVSFELLERWTPPVLRLSTTVALEHFTATMARHALTRSFLDGAHPTVRDLLRWHAAEEIEHKTVAFDVLRAVDDRYAVRIAGLALATAQLFVWWPLAAAFLLAQEELPAAERRRLRREAAALRGELGGLDRRTLLREAVLAYLKPGFHPNDVDDYELARVHLAARDPAA